MKIFAKYESIERSFDTQVWGCLSIECKPEGRETRADAADALSKIGGAIQSATGAEAGSSTATGRTFTMAHKGPGQTISSKLRLVPAERVVTENALMDAIYDAGVAYKATMKK